MSEKEVTENTQEPVAEGEGEGDAKTKSSKKKSVLLIALALVVLLGGAGAAAFFLGIVSDPFSSKNDGDKTAEQAHTSEAEPSAHGKDQAAEGSATTEAGVMFVDMEEFLVNLKTSGKQTSFLKMTISLEVATEKEKQAIEALKPRIRDSFQVYLRELRAIDLQGASSIQRLREELLLRLNKMVYPHKVNTVLFKEILVQ